MAQRNLLGLGCVLFIVFVLFFLYCQYPTPPTNKPPTAKISSSAVPNNAYIGTKIVIDGSESNDEDNYPSQGVLSYFWQVDSIGIMEIPDGGDGSSIIYTPTDSGRHTIILTVSDSELLSKPATLQITVKSHPSSPVAVISVSKDTAFVGESISLSGSECFDPNNDINDLSFYWTNLNNSNLPFKSTVDITFTPDAPGVYNFMLVVADPDSNKSAPAFVRIVVVERTYLAPTVVTKPDSVLFTKVNKIDSISAALSFSPNENPLKFLWQINGAGEIIGPKDASTVKITSNKIGISLLKLTVSDAVTGALANKIIKIEFSDSVNLPPVANAGEDTTTFRNHKVTLIASESYDPEDASLSYKWIPPNGIENELSGLNEEKLIFTPTRIGTFKFQLYVSEKENPLKVDTDNVTVTVVNQAPIAEASISPNVVDIGQAAILSATGSNDPDDDQLHFVWTSFQNGVISDSTAGETYFTASVPGTHAIFLTVKDDFGGVDNDHAFVTVRSDEDTSIIAPLVEIEGATNTRIKEQIELRAKVSNADLQSSTFSWETINGGRITNTDQPSTSFSSDSSGTFYVKLVVTTKQGISASDLHEIYVEPYAPPTIIINGIKERIKIGESIPLDACETQSRYGRDLNFSWTAEYGRFSYQSDCSTTYTCDQATNDKIRLKVIDDDRMVADSSTFTVAILPNKNPIALISTPINSTYLSMPIELDGSYSTDPDGDSLTFEWSVQMNGGQFEKIDEGADTLTFRAVERGEAVIKLEVTDLSGATASDEEDIQILNRPPKAVADVPEELAVNERGDLSASGSNDDDGDDLEFLWECIVGTASIENDTAEGTHFTASAPGKYVVRLTVNDTYDANDKAIDIKTIDVFSDNHPPTADAGADTTVFLGQRVALRGEGQDVDDDTLKYHWTTLSDGLIVEPDSQNTFYHPNSIGDHYVYLTVFDGEIESDPNYKRITVMDSSDQLRAPIAVIPEKLEFKYNKVVVLDGSNSVDPNHDDNSHLKYAWAQDATNPQQVPLPESDVIQIQPPIQPGIYLFKLQVDNEYAKSEWDTLEVKILKPDVYVTQNTNAYIDFDTRTIQQAIQKASDRDSIFIDKGTYFENLIIPSTKSRIKLIGLDRDQTQIDGGNKGNNTIQIEKADSILIQGLLVSNGGIDINSKSASSTNSYNVLRGNRIQDRVRSGSHIEIMSSTNILIENNMFLRSGGGIHFISDHTIDIDIIENQFYGLSGSPIWCEQLEKDKAGYSFVDLLIKGNLFTHQDIDGQLVSSDPQSAASLADCTGEIDDNEFRYFSTRKNAAIVLTNSDFVIHNNNTFLYNTVDLKINADNQDFCPDICDWISSIKVEYGNYRCCK